MIRIPTRLLPVAICLSMLIAQGTAPAAPLIGAVGFDTPITANSINADDSNIVGIDSGGNGSLLVALLTDLLPPEADIDAFDFISPNRVYFSLNAPANVAGTIYQDEDLLLWDGATVSLAWQGTANGLPAESDLDAVSVIAESPLEFSFSIDSPASLNFIGGTFIVSGAAVIHFKAGGGFLGLDFDPGVPGLPGEANVDAINRPGDGTIVMSFDSPLSLAGGTILADDGDAVAWNPTSSTFTGIVFSASSAGLPGEADLDGVVLNTSRLNGYDGRPFGDFDNSRCTDIADFLFLLDNWLIVSPLGGAPIDIGDFLALLDYWNTGDTCP